MHLTKINTCFIADASIELAIIQQSIAISITNVALVQWHTVMLWSEMPRKDCLVLTCTWLH